MNPPPITQATFNPADWETRAFSGNSFAQASRAFNDYALAHGFSDGLPMIVPTQELVDEMLAGTTRNRDDVLGKLKMRGGVITVEKVAINAVMAGAQPEFLPVIIAAMEAYGASWEFDKMWYHPMSSGGGFSLALIVSGPIAEEIGMVSGTGWAGGGNEANNTIGRAVRLAIRNIGHNTTPYVDTTNRTGRFFDHTLLTFAENEAHLPAGWRNHTQMMGFAAHESTITLLGHNAPWTLRGNEANPWDPIGQLRASRPSVSGSANAVILPPAIARGLAYDLGFENKEAVKEWYATHNADGDSTPRNAGIAANTHIFVVGTDPGQVVNLAGPGLYGQNLVNTTQLISCAALTQHGRGPTVPSAPQNFEVIVGVSEQATLRWDAPLNDGGSPITGFQVSWEHGGNRRISPWTDVPGGAAAREFTITGLENGGQYFFRVRATNAVVNTSEIVGNQVTLNRIGGRGAWARVNDVRPYAPPTQNFSFDIFNNGEGGSPSRPNASLAEAGLIRMWTMLDGENALVPYDELVVNAVLPNGESAMEFVRINNMWDNPGNVNLIDIVTRPAVWERIYLTATLFGQTVEVILVNNEFAPMPDYCEYCGAMECPPFSLAHHLRPPDNPGILRIGFRNPATNPINLIPFEHFDVRVTVDGREVPRAELLYHWHVRNVTLRQVNIPLDALGANWQEVTVWVSRGCDEATRVIRNPDFVA